MKAKYEAMRVRLHNARQTQGISNHKVDVLMGKQGTTSIAWEYEGRVPNVLGLLQWADALGYDVKLIKKDGLQ